MIENVAAKPRVNLGINPTEGCPKALWEILITLLKIVKIKD